MNSAWALRFEKLAVATLVILFSIYSFLYVNDLNAEWASNGTPFTHLEIWLDAYIPFLPPFVVFYYLYYPWVLLTLFVVIEREHFYHAVAAFLVLQVLAVATFIGFPSHMTRPDVVGASIFHEMVRWIYSADHGYNLLPSLHVGHSVLVAAFYKVYKPRFFLPVAIGTAFISASTVFIKQHYVIDIPFGLAYSLVAFYVTMPVAQYIQSIQQRA